MRIGTVLIGVLAVAAAAYAQPPGPPRGGRGGPGGWGGPGGGFLGAEVFAPGRVVKNAPFSGDVVTQTTQTLADGSHIKQSNTVHVYRDTEGRTRREETLNLNGLAVGANNGTAPQVVFINDPVAHANYALDMTNRTATQSGRGPRPAGQPPQGGSADNNGRGPRPQFAAGADNNGSGPRPQFAQGRGNRPGNENVKRESLGTQMIEGVQAQGERTTRTIPAGQIGNEQPIQIVTETWYSPDLQMVVMRKSSDPRRGETITQLSNVTRGEPSATLFQVPVDFKVSTPPRPRQKQ